MANLHMSHMCAHNAEDMLTPALGHAGSGCSHHLWLLLMIQKASALLAAPCAGAGASTHLPTCVIETYVPGSLVKPAVTS